MDANIETTRAVVVTFMEQERSRFSTRRGNLFGATFGEVLRYLDYLSILQRRIGELGPVAMDATVAVYSGVPGPVSDEEMERLEASGRLHTELHLYLESFYLFADILLDRVAGAVEFYFGPARRCSLSSHHNLERHLIDYAATLGLEAPPDRLLELVSTSQVTVGATRDALITHRRDARGLSWGTMFDLASGVTWLGQTVLYPRDGEDSRQAPRPDDVASVATSYLTEMLSYLMSNRQSARLQDRND